MSDDKGDELNRHSFFCTSVAIGVLVAGLTATTVVAAQPATISRPDDDAERGKPWMDGTSMDTRISADKIFLEANQLMKRFDFAAADRKYQEAIDIWDHPVFHFNRAVAQINLLQTIDAYRSIESALRYGDAPYKPEEYQQAIARREQLRKSLLCIDIVGVQSGAEITLDGKPFAVVGESVAGASSDGEDDWCPSSQIVRAGSHQLVAGMAGYVTDTRYITGEAGAHLRVELRLIPQPVARRRYKAWIPWTVVAAGMALAVVGGEYHRRSANSYDDFDARFNVLCSMTGCEPSMSTQDLFSILNTAESQKWTTIGLYGAAGVTMAAGLVWVFRNQPRIMAVEDSETAVRDIEKKTARVTPILTRRGVGLGLQGRF